MTETIIERLKKISEQYPDAICYDAGTKQYSFELLMEQSDKVASYLNQQTALTKKAPILVFGGLQFEMLVTFLGCMKAGHAYIPVDGHTPSERLEQIISIAKPAMVISIEDLPIALEAKQLKIDRTTLWNVLDAEKVLPLPISEAVQGDENVYIIFTSGTTGVPKGVQISHDNLISFSEWMANDFPLGKNKRFLAQAPFSFDLSVMDLYPSLLSGGTLVPLTKEVTTNFKLLFEKLPTLDLNVWVSTPSFMDICLMEPHFDAEHYPSLETFLFCGEELTNRTATLLNDRFPKAAVFNTYGPTEATVAITEVLITPEVTTEYPRLPIGRVKSDTEVILVDEELNQVVSGMPGEMVITGPSVSKGYLNNPEKTAETFYQIDGVQAYRTGDIGKYEGDQLFYQGRIDFQVKLHGYRIELEDIDHNIEQVSYVKAATVVPKIKDHKVQSLVAFVVAKEHDFEKNYQLTNAIKKELQPLIMDYMMPQKWNYVEQLPLTQNGKVDRKGLMNEVNS
ncbi:D-alanine--poly(phosphoribitol) ligase subunit 1 [Carnobacterium divergens]|uniref:D-alanine--poly(phosphoribitol) ligase subunit DltA n=1 Tax=Carnobacterium divergens TaxID=2748 RepID=UPI000D46DDA1|nr:D-alanine--poly(phosphoribitol) ligase subunit DltA [Carnobacterium divergens]MCO6017234.1 D-alanine--poly(phosphoribitol) ligase subunit DltA [Carnobacterium divergens]TFI61317.1 D-alanine--poly(phosphoribitol) ligase subunit 1 [Carnobacterium divergens]TFI88338.1 D-alanine--poly(phosphoribitol) ligase subunit 1 [Carnobacterium divergens]TFJ02907.1 D-alanine--poly(phosphoribitol) ligase subunit 1 [Carnobacterium divergens]TFJ04456.1 D-alanine--poly(phosphoribitol) ligase subunit 1 [Carnoba